MRRCALEQWYKKLLGSRKWLGAKYRIPRIGRDAIFNPSALKRSPTRHTADVYDDNIKHDLQFKSFAFRVSKLYTYIHKRQATKKHLLLS